MTKVSAKTSYGSVDYDKSRKDLIYIVKNTGTYASPAYATGSGLKITMEDLPDVLNQPRTVRLQLTTAEVKALNTSPKTIVAAPGGGYAIMPIAMSVKVRFQSARYDGASGSIQLRTETDTASHLTSESDILSSLVDNWENCYHTVGELAKVIENRPLKLYCPNDHTAGDSIITVWVTYQIIKV